ncbi:MAG: Uma2 family endonuclease [Thiolinea sp.]
MSAVMPTSGYLSEQDYLDGEKLAKERHEYIDGQVFAMAGASKRHNEICLNLALLFRPGTKGNSCRVFSSDVKVRISKRKSYYYPDVVVGCSEDDDVDDYYLEQPCLIVEVTSKSTEWKDYNEKLLAYQSIPSLKGYIVVAQEKPHVSHFYRDDDGEWWVDTFTEFDQIIELPCPKMSVSVADIYDGIVIDS